MQLVLIVKQRQKNRSEIRSYTVNPEKSLITELVDGHLLIRALVHSYLQNEPLKRILQTSAPVEIHSLT